MDNCQHRFSEISWYQDMDAEDDISFYCPDCQMVIKTLPLEECPPSVQQMVFSFDQRE